MNKHGYIKGVDIQLRSLDEDLYNHIIEARGFTTDEQKEFVRQSLRHNLFSFTAFSDLTDIPVSSLTRRTRPEFNEGGEVTSKLDYTYLFNSLTSKGFKFIIRNQKSEELLRR